jgi:hypothetical protein
MNNVRRTTVWRALAATAVAALAVSLVPGIAAAAIQQPTGLSPNDASGALVKNLELGWSAVSGASSYEVQVAQDESFEGQVLDSSSQNTHFAVPVSLPRGGYVWRVRAQNSDGPGPWSDVANLTRGWTRDVAPGAPHLVTSAGSAVSGAFVAVPAGETPAFTWDPMPGASFYELEVSNVAFTSSSPVYSGTADKFRLTCYTQRTWFAPYGVVAGASDAPGDESKCALGLSNESPPADGSIGSTLYVGVTYFWRVRGRDGSLVPGITPFADPALSCTGVWSTSGGTATGSARVLVIPSTPPAYRAAPECSQWSEGGSLTIGVGGVDAATTAPTALTAQPTTGDPAASRVALTGTPVLQWTGVPGAVMYRVYLSRTKDFTDSDTIYETYSRSLSPAASIADKSVPTYWTVQACGWLTCGPAAAVQSFTKTAFNSVKVLDSASGAVETTLSWSTQFTAAKPGSSPVPFDDQAASYELQVSSTGDWTKPEVDVTVDNLGDDAAATYYRTATTSLPDRYVWRVRAKDEIGRAWGWAYSAPYGHITTASGFGLGAPITVQFTEPVSGVANGASILDAADHTVAGTFDQRSTTEWVFTANKGWMAGQSYHLSLAGVTDRSGRTVRLIPGSVRAALVVDSGSRQLTRGAGDFRWRTVTASDASGKSFVRSSDKPATARKSWVSASVKGPGVTVWACKSPRSGQATVLVDGKFLTTLKLFRKFSGCGLVYQSHKAMANTVHTVKIVTTGHKSKKSTGYHLSVDAIGTR